MRREKLAPLCLALASIVLIPVAAVAQNEIMGDWRGAMKADHPKGMKLRLVVHIAPAPDGTLTATIDSIDQDSPGIPVKSVTFSNSILKLDVSQVQASFEGSLNKQGTEIDGIWTEGQPQTLKLKRVTDEKKWAPPVPIGGEWQGSLNSGGRLLNLALHINTTNYSRPVLTIDGIDENKLGVNPFILRDNVLKFTVGAAGVSFVGTVSKDGDEIQGIWKQGLKSPLIFHRVASTTQSQAGSEPIQTSPVDFSQKLP
jgi:hypothetical protein